MYRIATFVSEIRCESARGAELAPRRASRRPAKQPDVIMAPHLRSLSGRSTAVGDQQAAGSVRAIAHPCRRQAAVRYRPQSGATAAGVMQDLSLLGCARASPCMSEAEHSFEVLCGAGVRTTTSPREAVEMFYAAQNAGDTEQIAALMAEDVEYHDMVSGTMSSPQCVASTACR